MGNLEERCQRLTIQSRRIHPASSQDTSPSRLEYVRTVNTIRPKTNQEKGRDVNIVEWFGDDNPENLMNWSLLKEVIVTSELCLLTFPVYIGSAMYSAGTEGVMTGFHVSQAAATLGLTLFVAGYGLGPMMWAPMSQIPQLGRNQYTL